MEAFASYMLRSAVWLTGFALVYLLFLRKERFFRINRIYLLAGIIASIICPAITLHYNVEVPAPAVSTAGPWAIPDQQPEFSNYQEAGRRIDYTMLLAGFYLTGILAFLLKDLVVLIRLFQVIKISEKWRTANVKLIRSHDYQTSFSFFSYVFISPSVHEDEAKEILNHELVHINQKHWLDLLLGEFIRLMQWANPFAWIYNSFIRMNHEYLADETAIRRSADPALYRAALLNQVLGNPVISLSNSFNYSVTGTRFDMMKKIKISPFRKLRVLFALPVVAMILYAYASPEYVYESLPAAASMNPTTIFLNKPLQRNIVKGIVTDETGNPLKNVRVSSTGQLGTAKITATDENGRYILTDVDNTAVIGFSLEGYINKRIPADFSGEMKVILKKDPDFRGPDQSKITRNEEAPKTADGMKFPYKRKEPGDYPTFQGKGATEFSQWVADHTVYPPEAASKNLQGRISINIKIETDGTVSGIKPFGDVDPILLDAAVNAIRSAPKWDPPLNTGICDPYSTYVNLHFVLPDKVFVDQTYLVVEKMPSYPGGDKALLDDIASMVKYPESLKDLRPTGRVIVRFVVSSEGNVENASILKGVHPLLDAEALRAVKSLKKFVPGEQSGKPVSVWFMVPVNFTWEQIGLPSPSPFSGSSTVEILKFIAENTRYPFEARKNSNSGTIYVTVRMQKGGIVRESKAVTSKESLNVPIFKPVVIVGYKADNASDPNELRGRNESNAEMSNDKGMELLEQESERVAGLLGNLNIPEWKDKDMEFALSFNYILK